MAERIEDGPEASSVVWDSLEEDFRQRIQQYLQELLEEELEEFLGRARYVRRSPDQRNGYRNGHGRPRSLSTRCGTIQVRRPRLRGLDEPFESRVLPFFMKRTQDITACLPQLYLHGLSLGDFDLALAGLLGDDAPVSAATVARLKEVWHGEYRQWQTRPITGQVVYLWIDGLYVKAGLEKDKAALLVVVAGFVDGHKEIVALQAGYRESTDSWADVLRDLKSRGMNTPAAIIGDGHLGIWSALREIYPTCLEQRCWNHKMLNVLDKLPRKVQPEARTKLRAMMYADSQAECETRRDEFARWCQVRQWLAAAETLQRDWERLVTFFQLPREHWVHLRTSNIVESPFAAVRLRTNAAKRFKRVDNATAAIWKMLMVGQQRFKPLVRPELLPLVLRRVPCRDGELLLKQENNEAAA
jgi:transposase-like protein